MPSFPSLPEQQKQNTSKADQAKYSQKAIPEGKALPSNIDAEQGLLAACIVDSSGEVIGRCVEEAVTPDHFTFTVIKLFLMLLFNFIKRTKKQTKF